MADKLQWRDENGNPVDIDTVFCTEREPWDGVFRAGCVVLHRDAEKDDKGVMRCPHCGMTFNEEEDDA